MIKKIEKLKRKHNFILILLVIVGYIWILVDQYFISKSTIRLVVFGIVISMLYLILFNIVKPQNPYWLANKLALILTPLIILEGTVVHLFIKNDFTYQQSILWLLVGITPYFSCKVYKEIQSRKSGNQEVD